jgi:hypothetical protein
VDRYLRDWWNVHPDPEGVEYVQSPAYQLRRSYLIGDCDDAATLAACLLAALDWPCVLVAIRLNGAADFSHVYCHAGGIDIDPIVPAEMLPLPGVAETIEVSVP